jgi:regulator of RNase E activity RraA
MSATTEVRTEILDFLRQTDTCTVSNAIETFRLRMRNEGYIHNVARCLFPALPPVAGYAVTGRVRTSAPPIANLCYYNRADWWRYVASLPSPKIIVMDDVDRIPGTGALFGEIHAQISRSLGCVAYVSNGSVRDVGPLEKLRFPCFVGGVSVSHSYAHVIDFGEPVEIGGQRIAPGDLLHGDRHGVHIVPTGIADRLRDTVAAIVAREAELISFCQSPGFSIDKLEKMLGQDDGLCHPTERY